METVLTKDRGKAAVMQVRGTTKLLCVIGCPVEHTLSPFIHQILIDHAGDDFAYVAFRVEKDRLHEAIAGAHALGIRGINVTIPHKQAVMAETVSLDKSARIVQAVNTLKWTEEGYIGYNTDVDGFAKLAQIGNVPIKGNPVLILGAGGAAHSAVAVSYLKGASVIRLWNRSAERAAALKCEFEQTISSLGEAVPAIEVVTDQELLSIPHEIVFNTTSAGMYPKTDALPVEAEAFYDGIQYGLDMVFNPAETAFTKKIRSKGGFALGGQSMLFYQGLRSYEIWTDRSFSETEAGAMHEAFLAVCREVLT